MKYWKLGAAALALALMGCGPEQKSIPITPPTLPNSPVKATPQPAAGVSLADLDAVPKAGKPYKIVLIVKTKSNSFFIPMIKAFEETAKELGVQAEVQAAPQEDSFEQQMALVQNETSKGQQAILITPADSKALVPALKAAQAKGILVLNLDNRLDADTVKSEGLELSGYVGADNVAGGKKAGEALVLALNGSGKVAVLEGILSADNARARKQGFDEAAKGKLETVADETGEWDRDKAYNKMQAILTAHPDLRGVFCANDSMAIGAMKAIKEAGKTGKIKVVSYDNIPDVQPALASGELTATIEQHPELMGKYGVRMAVGILDGKIKKGGEVLVPLETIQKK